MRLTRDLLLNVATCGITLCAGVVVWERFHRPPVANAAVVPTTVRDWRSYTAEGQRLGPPNARISLVVFSDYQCPYCRAFAADVKKLRQRWPNEVAVLYRQYPLGFHANAKAAAISALCAARQGRFEQFHDVVFAKQDSLTPTRWPELAREAGLNLAAFEACRKDDMRAVLLRDSLEAARLGATGTPTFLLNEHRFVGSPGFDTLDAYVRRELKKQTQSN